MSSPPPLPALVEPWVGVDWGIKGHFDGAYDVVTRDTAGDPGVVIDTGRDGARVLNPPKVPSVDLELYNDDGTYSHESASSPVYQLVTPGTPVLVTAAHGERVAFDAPIAYDAEVMYDGMATWPLATTRIDDVNQTTAYGQRRVRLLTLGESARLVTTAITLALVENFRTDQVVNYILDAVGWPHSKREIALGDTTLLYWWAAEVSAWDALMEVCGAEGPATMYEDANGVLHWEGRNYRAVTPRSTTPQATFFDVGATGTIAYDVPIDYDTDVFFDGGTSALWFVSLDYEPGWKNIYGRATYATNRRDRLPVGVVWSYGTSITLGPDQARTFLARTDEPFTSGLQPELGVDYAVSAGSATVAITTNGGSLATIQIVSGPSGVTITGPPSDPSTGLRVRGVSLPLAAETVVVSTLETDTSEAQYGGLQTLDVRGWPEVSVGTAESVCNAWAQKYQRQRPQITLAVHAADGAHFRQIVERDVSDRIRIRERNSGLEVEAWIEARQIVLASAGGRYLRAVWQCEKAELLTGEQWDAPSTLWGSAVWGT